MIGNKGISPVVAVVLLIAIAVIAAIGVWYWVGAFTGKPPTGGQQQVSLTFESCNGTHVIVRNTGGIAATATASIYNSTPSFVGLLNFTAFPLNPGNVTAVPFCNGSSATTMVGACPLTTTGVIIPSGGKFSGTFTVVDNNYPTFTFSC